MRSLASLVCGYVFGWGLFISGMIRPEKVLGFLDILAIPSGNWDPSLAIVMAAALVVTAAGYASLLFDIALCTLNNFLGFYLSQFLIRRLNVD